MAKPVKGGTMRKNLEQVYKQTGIMPKALRDAPKIPEIMTPIWMLFLKLNDTRRFSRLERGTFSERLTYSEIKAYVDLTGTHIPPRDIEVIKRLDSLYVEVMNSG